ncbi:tetrapyrrole-binding protein, chloroplastic [Solanum dulcamara]|uniref:tetrapyrrole-binding protein, chloroplastic n=1 Tax=Solanum dulcamara TaxID=45834 RepID=UPI002485C733|nr:tetrapyrrole-binding protein, chloroplastic [Solanum dulcamara]
MATNSFNSIHQTLRRRHSIDCSFSSSSSSFFLKPTITKNPSSSTSFSIHNLITFSVSSTTPTTTTTTTTTTTPFDVLEQHLSSQKFREADEETRRLLIALAGEAAIKRGYVFFSEVQFISESDLKEIDSLWRKYSDNKFGYSVQKKIWNTKVDRDFTNFFIKVGWMKKLEIEEVDQYNYRAFPNEFIWELKNDTPEGHLPLTNALRGTQLLKSILTHPAFVEEGDEDEEDKEEISSNNNSVVDKGSAKKGGLFGGLRSKLFSKPDYSF